LIDVTRRLMAENPHVRGAVKAMRERGLAAEEIEREVAQALLGCLWEIDRGQPDRFVSVLQDLADGSSAPELFPHGLFGRMQH
jgi:hypothetical protein